jgi:uncharacterized protein
MWVLAFACGVAFGIAFALTGVGSVFAVPMLVYAIGLRAHQAVCVAMMSVSSLSALLTATQWRRGEIEFRAGAVIAATGVFGAPLGAWLGRFLSGRWLMFVFACVITLIAVRMLLRKREPSMPGAHVLANKATPRLALALARLTTGILAGLLGIGGLLIIPSLVFLAGMEIHRAIATSPLVVLVIGLAAISSHFFAGQIVPPVATAPFVVGGALGTVAGLRLRKRLPERQLQIVFAAAMLGVAAFILGHTFG